MANAILFNTIDLPQNKRFGNALREALLNCNYNLVARIDSDDISAQFHFEKTPEESVKKVGGYQVCYEAKGEQKSIKKEYPPFSVAISVYKNDNPEWFDTALDSIINQTVKPSEIVLVVDGSVPDSIKQVIDKYARICATEGIQFDVVYFAENRGLGQTLKVAIEHCKNELIARMDSDDIAVSNRFELQLDRFSMDDIDVCGGQIEEFVSNPSVVVGKRAVPESDKELKEFMKKRCPFNHMTVMFRRDSVIDSGNYQDWFWNEDYYLWIRMALEGFVFANLPEILVHARVGDDMYRRRGGDKYFKSEVGIQKLMVEKGLIDKPIYVLNCAKRFIVQKIMPNSIRGWVFKKFARNH